MNYPSILIKGSAFAERAGLWLVLLCLLPLTAIADDALKGDVLKGIDVKKAQALKLTPVSDYFDSSLTSEKMPDRFDGDVQIFITNAQKLGVFPPGEDFREWWRKNRDKHLKPDTLKDMKDLSVSEYVTKMFLLFTAEQADKLDKADPKTAEKRKKGEMTEGDKHFVNTVENANNNSWSPWLIGGLAGAAGAIWIKLVDVFFHGPIAQIMNTTLEPVVRPVRERVDLLINTHVAPHLVGWANFVTGEWRRRQRARRSAEQGEELNGALKRYEHPAISVEAFTHDTQAFYNEMLKADYAWRGWIAPELARARNTGFELLYHQYRLIGEQLTGYQNSQNVNKLLQAQINLPALLAAGAKQVDIDEFSRLVRERHERMVYKDVRDPGIAALEPKIQAVLENWTQTGIPAETVRAFYEAELESLVARDRPAFLLASVLDGERYFQENNLALRNMPKIQEWQEQAREMTGFYNELEKHRANIQRFFDKKGLKYDVAARIAQRGFPLGGPMRPASTEPVRDCVGDYLRLGKQAAAAPPSP